MSEDNRLASAVMLDLLPSGSIVGWSAGEHIASGMLAQRLEDGLWALLWPYEAVSDPDRIDTQELWALGGRSLYLRWSPGGQVVTAMEMNLALASMRALERITTTLVATKREQIGLFGNNGLPAYIDSDRVIEIIREEYAAAGLEF